jgi:hypothetical protein
VAEHVGDKSHIREPLPRRDIRNVRDSELVRAIRLELLLHFVGRIGGGCFCSGRERCFSPSRATNSACFHDPRDLVPSDNPGLAAHHVIY